MIFNLLPMSDILLCTTQHYKAHRSRVHKNKTKTQKVYAHSPGSCPNPIVCRINKHAHLTPVRSLYSTLLLCIVEVILCVAMPRRLFSDAESSYTIYCYDRYRLDTQ